MAYSSEHDLGWWSDPDYDRSGELIESVRDDDPRNEYNPDLDFYPERENELEYTHLLQGLFWAFLFEAVLGVLIAVIIFAFWF